LQVIGLEGKADGELDDSVVGCHCVLFYCEIILLSYLRTYLQFKDILCI
jgi:hypothetical protein